MNKQLVPNSARCFVPEKNDKVYVFKNGSSRGTAYWRPFDNGKGQIRRGFKGYEDVWTLDEMFDLQEISVERANNLLGRE